MVLCISKNCLHKYSPDSKILNPSDFILVVNNAFTREPHKAVYNKLRREYICVLEEAGVDVLYTSDVSKYCFKQVVDMREMKFTSMKEKVDYLSGINKTIFTYVEDHSKAAEEGTQ